MHAIEYCWLNALRTGQAVRLSAAGRSLRAVRHACAQCPCRDPAGGTARAGRAGRRPDAMHEDAGIQLRVLNNLWAIWDVVITSTLGFSGIRLRNARRRP